MQQNTEPKPLHLCTTNYELSTSLLQILNNECTVKRYNKYAIAGYNPMDHSLMHSVCSITEQTAYNQCKEHCFDNQFMIIAKYDDNKFKIHKTIDFTKVFD